MPSPVSSVLLQVPNSDLPKLRDYFLAQDGGITIVQFLLIFVKLMKIASINELRETLPELLFFFDLVDINADGGMDFSEFVMFVIDEVAEQKIAPACEKLKLFHKRHIQNAANSVYIKCCKRIDELKSIVVAAGAEFHIYLEDPDCPTVLKCGCKFLIRSRSPRGRRDVVDGVKVREPEVLDVVFVPSRDTFFLLRSDLCIEFVKVQSRSNIHQDTVEHVGYQTLTQLYTKLQIWESYNDQGLLVQTTMYAAGTTKKIDVWVVRSETSRSFELELVNSLGEHTDICRDILVIDKIPFMLLVSCGMDGKVLIWDLQTLNCKGRRRGHRAGVECLAYDGVATLFAGGHDKSVVGWNLNAETDTPVFQLYGHQSPVIQIAGMSSGDRAVSLDADGVVVLWDTTVRDTGKVADRRIDTLVTVDDHTRSVGFSYRHSTNAQTGDQTYVVCHGKQQGMYNVATVATKQALIVASLYSARLQMVVAVYTNEVVFWDADEGKVVRRLEDLGREGSVDITGAVLDDRQRKVVTGDSSGRVVVYNCATVS
jgi:WD40 repeat protein